jgi:hypothetical protein
MRRISSWSPVPRSAASISGVLTRCPWVDAGGSYSTIRPIAPVSSAASSDTSAP